MLDKVNRDGKASNRCAGDLKKIYGDDERLAELNEAA